MKNQADYSKYKCPYSHLEKDCGHELKGPEGYENVHGVWCACGFRGPVFCLDPEELNLQKLTHASIITATGHDLDSLAKIPRNAAETDEDFRKRVQREKQSERDKQFNFDAMMGRL